MTSRIIILVVALVLAIAAMVYLNRTAASLARKLDAEQPTKLATPTKTERVDHSHHPDRFLGLDPPLHQLARRLEELQITWEHNRPLIRGGHADRNDWLEFAFKQAEQLETSQIKSFLDWLEDPDNEYLTEVWQYRQAFYKSWASRDPEAARDHVIALARDYDVLTPEAKKLWRNPYLDDAEDMYHFVLAGSAIHDASRAWKTIKDDLANPALQNLPDASITTPDIFKSYASQAPTESWQIVRTESHERLRHRMLEGYADGAPAGQDWASLGAELVQFLESREIKPDNWTYEPIATRWVTEDPTAALDWYATHATLYKKSDPFDFDNFDPRPEVVPPAEHQEQLKIELLANMYGSHKDRTDEVVQALDRLTSEGHSDLAISVLEHFTGDSLNQWSTPLLAVVPGIPDPEVRNNLFLRLVNAIHPRMHDEFSHSNNPLTEPNIPCEAVKQLAGQLDLPDDIQAKAEATFRKIEEQEAIERAKMRKARSDSDPDDPPAPE